MVEAGEDLVVRRFLLFLFTKIEGKRCLEMSSVVRPGHVRKLPLQMAVRSNRE